MNNRPASSNDITRITLAVLFILILITASLWVVRPFLTSFIWAVMIVIATWPQLLKTQRRLGGRRWAAVTVMTLALLLILIIPFSLAVLVIAGQIDEIAAWTKSLANFSVPPPPESLHRIPLAGPRIAAKWQQLAEVSPERLYEQVGPYAGKVGAWFIDQAGNIGMMLLRFLLTVVFAAILYASGEKAAEGVLKFASRLAGDRGRDAAILAARAVRAVALGLVLTSIVQSIMGGIGVAAAGIPMAAVLTGIMFVLTLAQVGPAPVLFPAVGWLYWSGDAVRGTILLVWALFVTTFDNFLRPILIRKGGADLPLSLVFPGVIGGLVAFGIIGLFIGPVVLVVTYTLLAAWVSDREPDKAPDA